MPASNLGNTSNTARFTGSSSAGASTTLVATNVGGTLVVGQTLSDAGGVITAGTTISAFTLDGTNASITMSASFDLGTAGVNVVADIPANPSTGTAVTMDPFSGSTGSLFDFDTRIFDITSSTYGTTKAKAAINLHHRCSTGGLSTGIGFGANHIIGSAFPSTSPVVAEGFDDNYVPGTTMPDGTTAATTAILVAIGGGRSNAASGGIATTNPYSIAPLQGFGSGGSRDGGTAGRGFATKTVTATGTTASGSAIETGFNNRSGVSMSTGQSAFGQNTTQTAAIT